MNVQMQLIAAMFARLGASTEGSQELLEAARSAVFDDDNSHLRRLAKAEQETEQAALEEISALAIEVD